ncbi:MAG: hypothetical protein ACP5NZ_01160 [Nanobdellota archaeon]
MNFRPTLWKTTWSIIIAILTWMLTYVPVICHVGEPCFPPYLWVPIVALILVYIVWSLFQRKKK